MGGYYSPWENPNLPSGPRGESLTQRLAERDHLLHRTATRTGRFWPTLSFYAVHGPIQTTRPLWSKYRDKASKLPAPAERFKIDRTLPVRQVQDNPIYAGLIEEMDTAVGRVLTRLDELGLADNTIVCFTGDNGGVTSGDSFSSSELPYRGGKGRQWEGGLRVPFYIKAPGVTRPGSTCDTPVIDTDFYPTILQLAGLPLRPRAARGRGQSGAAPGRRQNRRRGRSSGTIPITATRAANPRPSFARATGNSSIIGRTTATSSTTCPTTSANSTTSQGQEVGAYRHSSGRNFKRGSRKPGPQSRSPIRSIQKPGASSIAKTAQAAQGPPGEIARRLPRSRLAAGSHLVEESRAERLTALAAENPDRFLTMLKLPLPTITVAMRWRSLLVLTAHRRLWTEKGGRSTWRQPAQ